MYDLLDLLLLRRGTPVDDRTLAFRRIDGRSSARVIYFLPWHTPFAFARRAGFLPLDFLACYEMPPAIVSSQPNLCAQALRGLVEDAERRLGEVGIQAQHALVVGLSVGSFPATFLANRTGARLCSVASADRADLALWQSPATRSIKIRALQAGIELTDYAAALSGAHPAHNLATIGQDSVFLLGQRDPFIPAERSAGLLQAIAASRPDARVVTLDGGHFKTLVSSGRYQRAMLGIERRQWALGRLAWSDARKLLAPRIPVPVPSSSLTGSSLTGPVASARRPARP
jgi:hypothetical protein